MALTVVDLFAGCGGLGLGLEQAGFTTVFVNELHDDARSTYLRNRLDNEWLQNPDNQSSDIRELTVWPAPREDGSSLHEQWRDVQPKASDRLLERVADIRRQFGDITLVTGGPPCQGFSGIGHRRTFQLSKGDIPSNYLFRDMVAVVEAFAPKVFLFENVRGLLSARWTPAGSKGEIWRDVREAFAEIKVSVGGQQVKYRLGHHLARAKDYGVPQNRPRVLLVGVREDLAIPDYEPIGPHDFTRGLIPLRGDYDPPHPIQLWRDLDHSAPPREGQSADSFDASPNDEHPLVEALRRARGEDRLLDNGEVTEQEHSKHSARVVERFKALRAADDLGVPLPGHLRTKKFAQRVIPPRWEAGPTITATSLPDDYVHYRQNRTPTVREWARLQTFPDWYEFSGKRTTGGRRRAGDPSRDDWSRELPKYTQIGNAVPVELARQIGLHLRTVLSG